MVWWINLIPNIIKKFVSDHSDIKADFITADGGFNWKDENYQEQEAYILLLCEIYCALKTQKKGGCLIVRMSDCFYKSTVDLIYILSSMYEKTYVTKPTISPQYESERFLVCSNFVSTLIVVISSHDNNNIDFT